MELPVYELTIDDFAEDRVEAIAFVDNPAIQRNWMAFNDQTKFEFSAVDTEKRIVAGPLMVAEMPIYRNYQGKEFFVKFSAKTIEAIVDKFMAEGRINAFNYMHNEEQVINDVYLQQSFIIDSTKGINTPQGYETLADGSWFGFVKVNNDEIWNDFVKTGKLKGFSVEGNFSQKEQFNNQIMTKLEEMLDKLDKKLFGSQEKVEEKEETEQVFSSSMLTDGTEISYEGELKQGTAVTCGGQPCPDGQHTLEDGTVISVMGGVVESIAQPETETEVEVNMSAEIESLKLHVAELKTAIESLPKPEAPKDFSAEINELKEANKEMFNAFKEFIQASDETSKKDTFKKADAPMTKWELMAENKKNK